LVNLFEFYDEARTCQRQILWYNLVWRIKRKL